jgi:hypothetical protein
LSFENNPRFAYGWWGFILFYDHFIFILMVLGARVQTQGLAHATRLLCCGATALAWSCDPQ